MTRQLPPTFPSLVSHFPVEPRADSSPTFPSLVSHFPVEPRADSSPIQTSKSNLCCTSSKSTPVSHLATPINLSHHLLCFSGGSSLARVRKCSSAQTFLIRPLRYVSRFDIASSSPKLQINLSRVKYPSKPREALSRSRIPGSVQRLTCSPIRTSRYMAGVRTRFPGWLSQSRFVRERESGIEIGFLEILSHFEREGSGRMAMLDSGGGILELLRKQRHVPLRQ